MLDATPPESATSIADLARRLERLETEYLAVIQRLDSRLPLLEWLKEKQAHEMETQEAAKARHKAIALRLNMLVPLAVAVLASSVLRTWSIGGNGTALTQLLVAGLAGMAILAALVVGSPKT